MQVSPYGTRTELTERLPGRYLRSLGFVCTLTAGNPRCSTLALVASGRPCAFTKQKGSEEPLPLSPNSQESYCEAQTKSISPMGWASSSKVTPPPMQWAPETPMYIPKT
jgi:hypothetical protein